MGAELHAEGGTVRVAPLVRDLSPISLRVPGDISAAAAWLVLGACHPDAELRLEGVGVNPTRTGVLDVLRLMEADVTLEEERMWGPEPVADLTVRSSRLRGAVIEGELVPRAIDELPLIALAACFATGETVIRDAAELRVKESDRIRVTARELRRLGADIRGAAGRPAHPSVRAAARRRGLVPRGPPPRHHARPGGSPLGRGDRRSQCRGRCGIISSVLA